MKNDRLPRSDRPVRSERRSGPSRAVHLSDYMAILREHKWVALVPFLLILGGSLALTLLAEPVYQADALVAIEGDPRGGGLLGELALVDSGAKVEAEMEIMRSRSVADGAVQRLAGPDGRMADFLVEVNRYRPLEVLLRAFGAGSPAAAVELACEPLPDGAGVEQYLLSFEEHLGAGRFVLKVTRLQARRFGSDRESELVDVTSGEPFTTFGRVLTLTADANAVGHTYSLTLRSREHLLNWLQARTVVSQMGRNTGIVALGCKAESPRLAQAASKALAQSFEQTKRRYKRDDADKAVTFLDERVEEVRSKLREAEAKLGEFQEVHGVTILSEKAKLLVEASSALEREKLDLELRLREQEEAAAQLRDGDVDEGSVALLAGGDDPTAASLAGQLTGLELEYCALEDELTDAMPRMKALRARMDAARERLRTHLLARAESEAQVTRRHIEEVGRLRDENEARARELPGKERELAVLTRAAASLVAMDSFLEEKRHEAQIARESVFSNVRIIDEPALPGTRTSPNLLVNTLVGLFLAVLAALGTAFFAEYLDRSIKTPEELEKALGLPLYAALPAFKSVKSRDLRKLKSAMVTIEKPHSVLAEGYRSLRANIRFADFESPVRTFAITSAVLGEGKTTTTLNLAVVLAQAGSKVLVVDADLRRPATHSHLKGKLSPGLSDVLLRDIPWRSVLRSVEGVENLKVIHGGDKPDNPGALFDSDLFAKLVEELKAEYEYVLFDVPPVLAVSDAAAFFRHLDALFLLVQWGRCPIDVVRAAQEQAERLGANLRGVIFNGFDARKSGRRGYGHYGYYGYYGYYGKYRGYTYGYVYGGEREKRAPEPTAR